ncbi:GH92 family glycosyl hydrolase [Anaeromassilibacillus senegalensis]|uniref:GH92 family glycosyl hydrolase n=1 Tax=Anaeromassilibacillus senegalensis TaxID=1673717 RepID=UPI00068008E6|nr:GH92 family glycosyl hydrolase [Anaeromassilibacillus senegalensis]
MKRLQKLMAIALAATLALPGSVLSTVVSARTAESEGFYTSFEKEEELSGLFQESTLEVVDGVGKSQNVISSTSEGLVGDVTWMVDKDSIQGSSDYNNNETKEKLFDSNPSTKYLCNDGASESGPVWVSFRLKEAKAIKTYAMVSANDAEGRDPENWTLSGSNDGETWTALDSQTGVRFSKRYETKTFELDNDTAYQYYKISITKNRSGQMVQFADLNLATLDEADSQGAKVAMATTIESGPASVHDAASNQGWTGAKALKVSGYHQGEDEAYAYNVLYDGLNIPVTENTQLSYMIFPEWTTDNYDFEYTSTYISVDLAFSDGTYLSDLNAIDQNGNIVSPKEQGLSKTLTTKQWNKISTYLATGEDVVGKTITKVLVGYNKPSNSTGDLDAFTADIDDIRIEDVTPVEQEHLSDYVYTLRGTNDGTHYSRGLVCPATTMPHGFNFWAPVTKAGDNKMYNYQHSRDGGTLKHLTISHQASFWTGERGTYEFMPNSSFDAASVSSIGTGERAAGFSHDNETARAHYYSVKFNEGDAKASNVQMEVTPTEHAAVLRFTYPEDAEHCNVILDCDRANGDTTFSSDGKTFSGYSDHTSNGMQRMYVYGEFSQNYVNSKEIGKAGIAEFEKAENGETVVELKVATSFISLDQAKKNLNQEIAADEGFNEIFAKAQQTWDDQLGIIELEGATPNQMTSFYSGMYRLFMYPNNLSEQTGEGSEDGWQYKSPYGKHEVKDGKMYYNNGFWDTYRTTWAAYSLLTPEKDVELLNGLVQHYNDQGWVPRWIAPGGTNSMVGTSSDVIFGDAAKKGLEFDAENAFLSALKNASVVSNNLTNGGRTGLGTGIFYGYTPLEEDGLSFSWAMEGFINDYGIYELAKSLGYADEEQYYRNRAQNYVNLFNPNIEWFMSRRKDGSFRTNSSSFNPGIWWGDYTETNAYNMAFSVPQDGQGLANLYGGREALAERLDGLFNAGPELIEDGTIHEMVEARDLKMGLYGHSNQPSHHIPYMYNYAGRPDRTQEVVREVLKRAYVGSDIGQGYIGDEDNGEMSAWYILSALGFYPVNMGSGEYAIGSPLFTKATIHLENGEDLVINAPNNSNENIYVQSVKLNGEAYEKNYFLHEDLAKGAVIDFDMGSKPSGWGSSEDALPASLTTGDKAAEPIQDLASTYSVVGQSAPSSSVAQDTVYSAQTADAAKLFDNTSASAANFSENTASVYYSLMKPGIVDMVTVTSSTKPEKAPVGFELFGSNDGTNWTSLEKREGLAFDWARYTRPFAVNATEKYEHYRLDLIGSENGLEIAELELLGNPKKSIDRNTLGDMIEKANRIDLKAYTTARAEAFAKTLADVTAVYQNENASEEDIRTAVADLEKALAILGTSRNAYDRLEGETFNDGNVVRDVNADRSGGGNIGGAQNGFWAEFDNVSFGENGAGHVVMSYSCQSSDGSNNGQVQLFLDSMEGEPFAILKTHNTGSNWSTYIDTETDIVPPVTGTHDVYLKLVSGDGKAYVANIDYFDFTESEPQTEANLTVQYSGREASLAVDGEAQKLADLIGKYKNVVSSGSDVELSFVPAVEGRTFAAVTLNGEPQTLTDPNEFVYTHKMAAADTELQFAFTLVNKQVLNAVVDVAEGLLDGSEFNTALPSIQKKFRSALENAQKVQKNLSATQKEIDKAWSDLLDIIHFLSFELGDVSALEDLITMAEAASEDNFTAESYQKLAEAIAAAKEVAAQDEPLKADVEKAYDDLYKAFIGLQDASDLSMLNYYISQAEEIVPDLEEQYLPDGQEEFLAALDAAKELTKDSKQKEIDAAAAALNKAMSNLRKIPTKDALKEIVDETENIPQGDYTASSYAVLQASLRTARAVLANPNATNKEIAAAYDAVVHAKNGLVAVEKNPSTSKSSGSRTPSYTGNSYGAEGVAVVGAAQSVLGKATVISDTTVDFTLRRGSAYCFKMTVNGTDAVPSFTAGDGSVLKTQFVAKIGNAYYYRVWAVGAPGASTGVYTQILNGEPQKHCAITIA